MVGRQYLRLYLFITLCCVVHFIEGETLENLDIKLIPKEIPEVNAAVELQCTGPLSNGGVLFFQKSITEDSKPVVGFEVMKVESDEDTEETSDTVVLTPGVIFDSNSFSGSLNEMKDSVIFSFKADIKLRGYYKCQFFGDGKTTNESSTPSVFLNSYYPSKVTLLEYKTFIEDEKPVVKISCSGDAGYPRGGLQMTVEAGPKLKKQVKQIPYYVTPEVKSDVVEEMTTLPISMELYNKTVTCVAGAKKEGFEGNPSTHNKTIKLNFEVPATVPKILPLDRKVFVAGQILTCEGEGMPLPKFSWEIHVNGETLKFQGSELRLPDTEGIFVAECLAQNVAYDIPYTQKAVLEFGVLAESSMIESQSAIYDLTPVIIASTCAAVFGVIAIVTTILYCKTRKQSNYEKM